MEKRKRIKETTWYPMAVAICIGVVLFVLLSNFSAVRKALRTFAGYFMPVIIGCVIAYVVSPLSGLFEKLFRFIKKEKVRSSLSILISYVLVVLFLVFALIILIPQLVESVQTFMDNWDDYVEMLDATVKKWGITESQLDVKALLSSSEEGTSLVDIVEDNMENIVSASTVAGRSLLNFVLGFILSIYLLAGKQSLKTGSVRILKGIFGERRYPGVESFLVKCDRVCNRYIVFNLIDSLIIGFVNAFAMAIFGMQYVGLVSLVVGVANLIPTFGPVIGLALGAFVLLMVNPLHALILVIITLVLQGIDGYILKPRLFGNSLGVSELWIMIGVIVGGNMFGVIGILVSIPFVAILDIAYKTYLLPALQKKTE